MPRLIGDAVRGIARVRRRNKERPDQPDMAKMFARRRRSSITWFRRSGHSRRPHCRSPRSRRPPRHLGVTFNDVVLAMAAGGLRELLLRYDGRADRPLLATVPVSTDRSAERITGNEISGITVSLPVHIDDPLERVRLTAMSTNGPRKTTICSARSCRAG